jgi:hypothetical protein
MSDVKTVSEKSKDGDRELWASGSYPRVAELAVRLAEDLVALADIAPGARSWTLRAGRETPRSSRRWPAGVSRRPT